MINQELQQKENVRKMETKREFKYKESKSKNGSYSPHLTAKVAKRLSIYCKKTNQNRTRFIEKVLNEKLDELEIEMLNNLSKQELIDLYLNK